MSFNKGDRGMPSDPVICAVCAFVFEYDDTRAVGKGRRACVGCIEDENLDETEARDNLLYDLTDEGDEL
jgi:hypothetical protein